jgi:hypothetical protein
VSERCFSVLISGFLHSHRVLESLDSTSCNWKLASAKHHVFEYLPALWTFDAMAHQMGLCCCACADFPSYQIDNIARVLVQVPSMLNVIPRSSEICLVKWLGLVSMSTHEFSHKSTCEDSWVTQSHAMPYNYSQYVTVNFFKNKEQSDIKDSRLHHLSNYLTIHSIHHTYGSRHRNHKWETKFRLPVWILSKGSGVPWKMLPKAIEKQLVGFDNRVCAVKYFSKDTYKVLTSQNYKLC